MEPIVFRAESMMEALQLVQENLGPDAIVISARDLPKGNPWQRGKAAGVEVAAIPGSIKPAAKEPAPEKPAENGAARTWQPRHISREELAVIREPKAAPAESKPAAPGREVVEREEFAFDEEPVAVAVPETLPNRAPARPATTSAVQRAAQLLLDQGVDPAYVARLVETANETLSLGKRMDVEACTAFFTRKVAAELKACTPETLTTERIACLVGSSGSGKTTTAAKLALFHARMQRKRIVWVCADTFRTSAVAEARSYTQALNIPLRLVYSPAELAAVLQEEAAADRIIVDTPGLNPWKETQVAEIGAFLAEMPHRLTLMAAAATSKLSDLRQAAAALDVFGISGVIFTKLDETGSFGNLFDLARQERLPLAYFTTGRESDQSLEPASPARLAEALFGKGWN